MNKDGMTTISKQVPISLRNMVKKTKEIWVDLDEFFQEIAGEVDEEVLEKIIKKHPIGNAFVEVL